MKTKFMLDERDIKLAVAHWMTLSADRRSTLEPALMVDRVTLRAETYGAIGKVISAEYVE